MGINNFDVLKEMAARNMDIMLCSTVTDMNYSAKTGTRVSIGVPSNVCFDIDSGKKNAVLLVFDMSQFKQLKADMETDAAPVEKDPKGEWTGAHADGCFNKGGPLIPGGNGCSAWCQSCHETFNWIPKGEV